jgi:hypothetical protein
MPGFASPLFSGFAFIGSLAVLTRFIEPGFRSITLRRRVFPVWLFIGAPLVSRKSKPISIQQMFYLFQHIKRHFDGHAPQCAGIRLVHFDFHLVENVAALRGEGLADGFNLARYFRIRQRIRQNGGF